MRKRRRTRRDTPAYRDGVIMAQLFTAENALLRIGNTRGLPEHDEISRAIVTIGNAIKKTRARLDRQPG